MFIDIKNFESYFQINDKGEIFSKRTNKILKQTISKTGYPVITTKIGGRNGKAYCLKVHRLLAQTFISNPNNLPQVNHIDGNKLNNNINNLEWVDNSANQKHAYSIGLNSTKGDLHRNRKISNDDVKHIRNAFNLYIGKKKYFYMQFAENYNLSANHIRQIVYNHCWV